MVLYWCQRIRGSSMIKQFNDFWIKLTNSAPRTERVLSKALALYHVISDSRDYLSVDEAKSILRDYIYLNPTEYNEFIRNRHLQLMQKIRWKKVIQDSLRQEFIDEAYKKISQKGV